MRIVAGIEHRLKQLEAMERILKMRVNMFVSDLFFNMDLADHYNEESGYNKDGLQMEAEWMLICLKDLGCTVPLPSSEQLVEDYLERI
jgi:hypothetical protein